MSRSGTLASSWVGLSETCERKPKTLMECHGIHWLHQGATFIGVVLGDRVHVLIHLIKVLRVDRIRRVKLAMGSLHRTGFSILLIEID